MSVSTRRVVSARLVVALGKDRPQPLDLLVRKPKLIAQPDLLAEPDLHRDAHIDKLLTLVLRFMPIPFLLFEKELIYLVAVPASRLIGTVGKSNPEILGCAPA